MNDIRRIPKKYEANYVFKQDSTRLWSLLSDESKIELLSRNTSIISTFLTQKANDNKVDMSFIIQEVSQLDYVQTITWLISLENIPKPIQVNLTFTVIPDTLANASVVTLTLYLTSINPHPSNVNEIVDGCKRLCIEILHGVNNYLSNHPDFLYEYESIQVACSIDKAWQYIISFEIFKVNSVDTITSDGDPMKEGTKISWVYPNEIKPIECVVYSIDYSSKKKKYEYVLKFSDGHHKKRIVRFTLIAIREDCTFISFFHELFEHITLNRIDEVKRLKQTIISSMKNTLENDTTNTTTTAYELSSPSTLLEPSIINDIA